MISIQDLGSFKLIYSLGLDENGKEIRRSKSYGEVRQTANDEDIFEVAKSIANLQQNTLVEVRKVENTILGE